jgi:hypothetical protein
MRENSRAKATRILTEGRIAIMAVDAGTRVVAWVRDDRIESVRYFACTWSCSCSAAGICAHLRAVESIVVLDGIQAALEFGKGNT